ncbi:hypothetical protein MKY34_16820 [Sporosarcina sp. FSL K6-1522]|uniref:hypothetical protein n=1 Tax=Sporosarcina sp. FSL K6-1522 TaxID=2921554 RepID=UPI00315A8AB5
MEINQEKLVEAIKSLAKWVEKVIANIRAFFHRNFEWLKKAAVKWYQLEEEKKIVVRQRHKRDFSRRRMEHQVIDCKPHMIRKIIR